MVIFFERVTSLVKGHGWRCLQANYVQLVAHAVTLRLNQIQSIQYPLHVLRINRKDHQVITGFKAFLNATPNPSQSARTRQLILMPWIVCWEPKFRSVRKNLIIYLLPHLMQLYTYVVLFPDVQQWH